MSLLDVLTGGKDQEANAALNQALQNITAVSAPTKEDLTLPELQQYVSTGQMTPAQAIAALQGSNAYDNANVDPATREAEMSALSQMQDVSDSGGMTGEMKAQLSAALNTANTNTQGERGSILDSLAQRGVSNSLMGPAAQMAAAGQDAQTANLAATQSAGQAEQNALTAMSQSGTLAGNIHNQDYTEQANKAAAQNAINQWNAQNTTANNQFNATNQQAANTYNTQNAQTIGNANTQNANARTQYNSVTAPQTAYQDAMQKAEAQAGIGSQQASQATGQGQQNAGIMGVLTGLGASTLFGGNQVGTGGSSSGSGGGGGAGGMFSSLGSGSGASGGAADAEAGMAAAHGAIVPGHAQVSGDSPRNDTVPARLSPGEVVIPRSQAQSPELAKQFVQHLLRQKQAVKPAHPHDVRSVLDALSSRREEANGLG